MPYENALIVGATSLVGRFLMEELSAQGSTVFGLCRTPPENAAHDKWIAADLQDLGGLSNEIPPITTIYSTGPLHLFAESLEVLVKNEVTRIVAFSSTSAASKQQSEVEHERAAAQQFIEGEQRLIEFCEQRDIAWTILRPTLVYVEGLDKNLTRIAHFIRRFHFFPLAGKGKGLRQPVHGTDLAKAAAKVARIPRAARKIYNVPGGETLSYAEMVGRVFDGVGLPRRVISVPIPVWKLAFSAAALFLPGATSAMGTRMSEDLVFDSSDAARDFGWLPRDFHPTFIAKT
ncbi:epimerase [Bradyrhizobium sp. CCBAU 53338]|nr:epimerase [Bradyrhizobium sp. CCBAU 53338]